MLKRNAVPAIPATTIPGAETILQDAAGQLENALDDQMKLLLRDAVAEKLEQLVVKLLGDRIASPLARALVQVMTAAAAEMAVQVLTSALDTEPAAEAEAAE